MKPTVLFVLGAVSRRAADTGVAITNADLALLERLGDSAGSDIEIVLACEARATHGRKPTMRQVRAERERLMGQIAASTADVVIAIGPAAVAALWNKGNIKVESKRMRRHDLPDVAKPVFATWSLEEIAFKGLEIYAAIDVQRAVAGEIPVNWGEYHVQTEMHPELSEYLAGGGERVVTVDLETFPGTNPYAPDARIRMVVVSHRSRWAQVVQAGPASEIPEWVQDLLRDPSICKVGSNIRFDVRWLRRFGYAVENYVCTHHTEHVLDENCRVKNLKSLSLKYHPTLGDYAAGQNALVDERSVRDRKGKVVEDGWRHISDEEMYQYAGGDGDSGITVYHAQAKRVVDEGLARPFEIMRTYYPAISELEMAGACVSMEENARLEERYTAELARLRAEIRGTLGPINVASSAQLKPALQAHCPGIDLTDVFKRPRDDEDDQYSTRAYVLKREAKRFPMLALVLEYRRRQALYNFVKGIRKHVVHINGRDYVFSSLRGDIVPTYRHSSSRPNMQNVPDADEYEMANGLNVKRQYVSRFDGGSILVSDQSQMELREAGMISGDQALHEAFHSGIDVHTVLASQMKGIKIEEVTKDIRADCKTTNFRVLYGGGAYGLALTLGCSEWHAQDLIKQFDETFTGYRRWERETHHLARTRGWVESRFGFRRRIIAPENWNSKDGRHALRQAANAPVQGGAGTTVNLGIVEVLKLFKANGLRSVAFMTVHDNLVVDAYPGEEENARELVTIGMEHPGVEKYGVELTIPLQVDHKIGPTWGETEDIK